MANVVITGANRGIGLALVKQYLDRGDTVYALCRNSSDELAQTNAKIISKVDVGNPETLPESLGALKDLKICLLYTSDAADD